MDLNGFVDFYHPYIRSHPDASLQTAVEKFVAAHFCHNGGTSSFGVKLHLNDLARTLNEQYTFGSICTYDCSRFRGVDDQLYFYKVDCPQEESQTMQVLSELISYADAREQGTTFQLFENADFIQNAPDGTYTYIVVSLEERMFIFGTQTNSLSEVATKHRHLLHRVLERFKEHEEVFFHYGGEIQIETTTSTPPNIERLIKFNFMSGTFMSERSGGYDDEEFVYAPEMKILLVEFASQQNEQSIAQASKRRSQQTTNDQPHVQSTIQFSTSEFITKSNIITPHHIIILYILAGLRVMVFESECFTFDNLIYKILRLTNKAIRKVNSPLSTKTYDQIQEEYQLLDPSERPDTFDKYFYIEYVVKKNPSAPSYIDISVDEYTSLHARILKLEDKCIFVRCSAGESENESAGAGAGASAGAGESESAGAGAGADARYAFGRH